MSKRRYMKTWREDVIEVYGLVCVASGIISLCEGRIEAHHLHYRGQGGDDDVWNGLPLCTMHHGLVHSRLLKVRREWLHTRTAEYLADEGVVAWDDQGLPFGRHFRGFAALSSR